MNPHKFWFWFGVLCLVTGLGVWLNPGYFYRFDWFWVVGLLLFICLFSAGMFQALLHSGGYPLDTYLGHSSTFNGVWSFEIPANAQAGYPEMVAFPKGGGNYLGFPAHGGRKAGWAIVPKEQVVTMNRNNRCNTFTIEVTPSQLPSHIRAVLETHELYDPRGMIEFGVWPFTLDLKGYMGKMKGFDFDRALARANEQIFLLEKELTAHRSIIRGQNEVLQDYGINLGEIPRKERVMEKVKAVVAGEDNQEPDISR